MPGATAAPGGGGGGGGVPTVAPPVATATPVTAAPAIVSFAVTQQPSCPEGDGPYRSPGSPAVVSWVVTGATSVTLSVDGPGGYGTYGTTGSVTLPFGCGAVGTTYTHTYMVTTNGGTGPAASRTISASATQR